MGNATFSRSSWADHAANTATQTRSQIFTSSSIKSHLDPKNIKTRESRDSVANPNSTAIILAVDVTGSMGMIAEDLVKNGLGRVMGQIIERHTVSNPHFLTMAIGDMWFDEAPLQVTQFEADLRVAKQLSELYLEGNGGGNGIESYNAPWYFAATRTNIDCWEKRRRKGYLFTIGDEGLPRELESCHISGFIGGSAEADIPSETVLTMAEETYEVFHVIIEEGSHARHDLAGVKRSWSMLGERVLSLSDYTKLPETIIAAIEINEGRDRNDVVSEWDKSTALTVANATQSVTGVPASSQGVTLF